VNQALFRADAVLGDSILGEQTLVYERQSTASNMLLSGVLKVMASPVKLAAD